MRKRLIWWILIIAWCIFIFYQSGKPAVESARESDIIALVLNSFIVKLVGMGKLKITEHLVRKTAHFIEYFILGALLFNGLYNKSKLLQTLRFSFFAGIFYAATDEIHQYFIPGRAMRFYDIAIDSMGIFFGTFLLYRSRKKRNE